MSAAIFYQTQRGDMDEGMLLPKEFHSFPFVGTDRPHLQHAESSQERVQLHIC